MTEQNQVRHSSLHGRGRMPSGYGFRTGVLTLLASTALCVAPAIAGDALPTGGSVAAGNVAISSSGGAMTVRQGSDKAIVNWQGFSIAHGNSVDFVQPDVHSAILNRVTGSTPSSIAGSLSANGQVFLVNPNGIAITKTGTVKAAGGFAASTLDIGDDDFMKGQLNFRGNGSSATVSNEGVISIGRGGYAALMGGKVKNDGLVAVPYGKAGFGAGEAITLDLSGDGFMQVAVPSALGDDDAALIDNSGTVSANGGVIVMKAATARNAARNAINMSGVAEARSVSGRNGKITLGGGHGGKVRVSGKVSTRAKKTQTAVQPKGGAIEITGLRVALDDASIDATGLTGGGTIRIGGDYQGGGTLQRAETLTVSAGTRITADAITTGDGGTVVLWSDKSTSFAGTISARGATGKGGDAEVSGKAVLSYTGFADLSGPGGFGTLLLDPYNVTVSDGADKTSSGFTASGNDSVINVTTLQTALASANVTVSTGSGGNQDGDITVANAVSWSSDTKLTLDAAKNINFAANVTATGDNAGLALKFGGDYALSDGAAITLSGTNAQFQVNGFDYTLIHSLSDLEDVNNSLAGKYALAGDIDASGETYDNAVIGIDDDTNMFTGTFAGLGHVISDLTIEAPDQDFVGLFGAAGAESFIRDIGVKHGSIVGSSAVGGLAGFSSGTITQSYATGSVSGKSSNVGGLVGSAAGTITQSYATGKVTSSGNYVGGLVGAGGRNGTITQSYATGIVTGNDRVGGLAGGLNDFTITNAHATGSVTGEDRVGGLVGYNDATISNAYATGSVTATGANSRVGGLVGLVGYQYNGTITNAYATGSVTATGADSYVGGLVGYNDDSTITNAYATGSVTATGSSSFVGGLVGYHYNGTITNAYATGSVKAPGADSEVGGLVGQNLSVITASYFDIDTTEQSQGVGSDTRTSGVTGLSTAAARNKDNYTGWQFDTVWYQAGDMRPILRSEAAPSVDGVIPVSNLHQLALMNTDPDASYRVTADIDASLTKSTENSAGIWGAGGFVPVGDSSNKFTGTFDGGGHVITGLTINRSSTNFVGLFGYTPAGSALRNIGLVGGSVTGSRYVGGLVGYSYDGTISNAYATGSVTGSRDVGGLVGYNDSYSKITNAYATGSVTATSQYSYVGGLVGRNLGAITNTYATGSVTGEDRVGGLVGQNTSTGTITNAYATGSVKATGSGGYVGGLVGSNLSGTITNAYATGSVTGSGNVGGLVGYNNSSGTITNAYATGSVTGGGTAGGLVGYNNSGTITNAYATGSVKATGADSDVGGLVGYNTNSGTITASYFDTITTGKSETEGVGNDSGTSDVTGLTTSQFENTEYFYTLALAAGWDFETVWAPPSKDHYPELYALSDVVFVKTNSKTVTYGDGPGDLSYSGVYGGHSGAGVFAPTLTTDASKSSDVGSYAISGQSSIEGDDGISYRVVYGIGAVTIDKATLTVTAKDYSMDYGDAVPTNIGYTVSGWKNTDGDGGSVTGVNVISDATSTSDVGVDYFTKASDGSINSTAADNYKLSYADGTMIVKQRAITVTAENASKTYGEVASLGYEVTSGSLVNDDKLAGALASAGAATTADVNSYDITQDTLSDSNYDITYVKGTLTVDQAALTVTANDASKTYDGLAYSGGNGVTYDGFVNGEKAAVLGGTLVYGGSAQKAVNAGSYDITASGLSSDNYAISYVKGTLTVDQAALTVTANDASKTYDGLAYSGGNGVTYDGLVNGEKAAVLGGTLVYGGSAQDAVNAGSYDITASGLSSGNYAISYADGALTIDPRAIAITANSITKPYGDVATLGYAVTSGNVVNGDMLFGSLESAGAPAKAEAGAYAITQGTVTDANNGNYAITYIGGTLTVTGTPPSPVTPPSPDPGPDDVNRVQANAGILGASTNDAFGAVSGLGGADDSRQNGLLTVEDPDLAQALCGSGVNFISCGN